MGSKIVMNGRPVNVTFVRWGHDTGEAADGEDALCVQVARPAPETLHLKIQGERLEVPVADSPEGTWVWVGGRARLIPAEETGTQGKRRRRAGGVPGAVTPPMPATVVRVLVQVGDTVDKGQGLVVLAAMKMETTLTAPHRGTVTAVRTEVGATVRPGEILVDVEAAGE